MLFFYWASVVASSGAVMAKRRTLNLHFERLLGRDLSDRSQPVAAPRFR